MKPRNVVRQESGENDWLRRKREEEVTSNKTVIYGELIHHGPVNARGQASLRHFGVRKKFSRQRKRNLGAPRNIRRGRFVYTGAADGGLLKRFGVFDIENPAVAAAG